MQNSEHPVLIIDDDADIRDALRDALEEEDYVVVMASNGQEGLNYLLKHPAPSMVLLDWMMPVMDGAQFCEAVAKEQSLTSIPIVLLTADARAKEKSANLRIAGFLKKPVGIDELLSVIQKHTQAKTS